MLKLKKNLSRRTIIKNLKLVISICVLIYSLGPLAKTHRPFVFIHGLGVPSELYQIPFSLKKIFEKKGHHLIIVKSPAIRTLKKAQEYATLNILKQLPSGTFHLVGHSQGGIVARLMAQDPKFEGRILSLTTLDSPHRGTPLADDIEQLWRETSGHLPPWAKEVLDKYFGGSIEAVQELSVASMEGKFNMTVLNNPEVRYFSMGHYIPFPEWHYTATHLLASISIYLKLKGAYPNDGALPLSSAQWGESIGNYPGDHWAESFPIPFAGKIIVDETFNKVIENIDKKFSI